MKKKISVILMAIVATLCLCLGLAACAKKVENVNLGFVVDGQTISTITTSGKEVVAIPNNPEKEGYTFDGWYWDNGVWNNPFTANSLLNAPISSDMNVYAHFNTIEYTITYTLDGGTNTNPSTYNIETPTITLADSVKVGYSFDGWYKESSFNNKVTSIAQGSLGNIELYAKFTINQYTISFNADGGSEVEAITQDYNTAISAPSEPTKTGYTFDGWFNGESQVAYEFTTMPAENISLKAKWTPIEYTISYDLVGGTNGDNPAKYTIETETITLADATKAGYAFDGWFSGSDKIESINKGSIGNVDLQAHWTPIEYTITYNNTKSADNSNPTKYTIESETITLVNLEKLGYTFNGWYNGTEKVTSINKGSMGNLTLTADWTVNGYEITYHNVDGATNSNPDVYDVEDEPLTLVDASKVGYTFLGWYTDAEYNNPISVITVGTIGDKDLYAKWEIIEYTASFKADNALVEDIVFTVETASLGEPSVPDKDGYTGEWENYALSANNLVINAVYTPITYSITYNNTKDRPNSNPIEYNIESDTITLANLSATGYTFDGWFNGENKVTEIASGTFGNITLTAKWTAIEYSINYIYDDTKGDLPNGETLKVKYTIEDNFDFVTLESKTVGYSFSGWYTEKVVGTGTKVDGVALGTTGNITVYGQWGADIYTITYHNVDGVTNTNATTYTIESEDFTITNLSKVGYTFEGWYSNNELTTVATTTIVKGSHGNLDLYAKWEKIAYTLTYNLYGGSYASGSNPANYTIEDNITLINPTQSGKFFVGWYTLAENGDLVKQIVAGTTGNITLYARWLVFDSKGGTTISYTPDFSTGGVTKPTDPTKDYYGFAGWYFDEQFTEEYNFSSLPTASSTLYAKWDATNYTITYVLYDGTNSVANPDTYTVEDSVAFADPSKTGHTFNGWYSNAQFTSALVTGIPVGSHGNITIYANFGINQYTISFNSNGGTSVDDITQNYATSVSAPANPAKNGYSFGGWYSDAALKTSYTFTTIPAENITLYAKWNLVTYNITYNLDGGTNSSANSATYTIESATLNLAEPSKTGYTFIGWYTDSSYTNAISSIENGSYGNKELFAKWQIITYSITYSIPVSAENSNQTEYTVITPATALAVASMTGYTFNGWYSDSTYAKLVTTIGGGSIGNITIYGKFTANKYDVWLDGNEQASCAVSFDLNGASGTAPATQNITETNTLVYPAIPTRSGYIFGGWYSNSECSGEPYDFSALIASNITLYAKWVSIGSANVININSTAIVQLSGTAEKVYKFIPLVSGNVSITSTGSIDTLGSLYKGSTLLKMDDDSGADSNFLIVYNVTAGEVYEIHVRGLSSSTNGSITLSLTGVATIAQGGYAKAGNKSEATFGASFKLPIPEAEGNYKFLGWQDSNGIMYTDGQGNSVINWNKAENSVLYSKWEKMEYTVTFITNGGSAVESVMLEYGSRLDLNQYVTTRNNYTFSGWYESASATEPYSAGTMPDHNITLYAKWTTFALGTIKYDEAKKAVSINDEITANLFNAVCIDTNGNMATFNVTVNGTQSAGNTITVKLTATSNGKTKQITITDIKIYGMPTINVSNDSIDHVNLDGGLTAEWFGASGLDTYGENTRIIVRVEGNYDAGDIANITIDSIDLAGNITSQTINNVKLYGHPEITVTNTNIKMSDWVTIASLGATAQDSFGDTVDISITDENGFTFGEVYSYDTTTSYNYKYFTATNTGTYKLYYKNGASSKRTYLYVYCVTTDSVVYNGSSYVTNTSYSSINLSVVEGNEYYIRTYAYGSSYTTNFSMYLTGASKISGDYKVLLTAIDAYGNKTEQEVNVKIYTNPTISSASCVEFKVEDNITVEALGLVATDTFGNDLIISLSIKSGTQTAGSVITYTASVVDIAGNTSQKDISVSIYGTPTITYDRTALKVGENAAAEYTVTFNLNGGEGNVPSQTVTSTRGLTYPAIPVRNGYVFRGWFTSNDCKTLYDFSATVTGNVQVYAGWQEMLSTYYSREIINVIDDNNSAENEHSFSTAGTSSTSYYYTYFTALTSGTYRVYYKNGSSSSRYGVYVYIYNMTKGSTIKSNATVTSTSYTYSSITANAGDVIYIRTYRSNTSYSGSTFSLYVTGASLPEAGGRINNYIEVSAKDSFGNSLPVNIELKSGNLEKGTYVTYTLTAVDKLGNVNIVTTSPIGIYDINDISFTYMNMASDLIKITSKGEEFFATATDSFGEQCNITIVPADGFTLAGGNTISLYIIATDKAGNYKQSELITGIKVYDMPTVELTDESNGYTITEDGDVSFLFVVYDSFGEELYAEITTNDSLIAGNTIVVTVTAKDDAGNILVQNFNIEVCSSAKPYVDLYIEGVLWKSFYATNLNSFDVPTDWRLSFIGWGDKDGTLYTDENGNLQETLLSYTRLFAMSEWAAIDTVEQLKNIKMDGKYILFANLNLNGESWTPIGTESAPFTGIFDGNSHMISNYKITNTTYNGLFGYSTGTIKNLRVNSSITNFSSKSGLLVGYNDGTIENCSSSGTCGGSGANIGGLVGINFENGVIKNCGSYATVSSSGNWSSSNLYTGGLVGQNKGSIVASWASGSVSGDYCELGGLVGYNSGTIDRCYATGTVSRGNYVGGLIARSGGSVTNCYATGSVTSSGSSAYAGGLIASAGGTVTNCYASGTVKASAAISGGSNNYVYQYAGGLIGSSSATVTCCFATGNVTAFASATRATNCGAYAYAGGLIGRDSRSSGTVSSSYRSSSQTVTASQKTPSATSDGTINDKGTSSSVSNIVNSVKSYWSSAYWNFSGTLPTLK